MRKQGLKELFMRTCTFIDDANYKLINDPKTEADPCCFQVAQIKAEDRK